nr:MAG TPA: hypothetical protein [Caudoviricetes sp.]
MIWLVPDQGQRYCYCLAVKRLLFTIFHSEKREWRLR